MTELDETRRTDRVSRRSMLRGATVGGVALPRWRPAAGAVTGLRLGRRVRLDGLRRLGRLGWLGRRWHDGRRGRRAGGRRTVLKGAKLVVTQPSEG